MHVHVDQPWQKCHSREIDPARTCSRGRILRGYGADTPVRDRDLWSFDDAARDHIHHPIGGDDYGIGMNVTRREWNQYRQKKRASFHWVSSASLIDRPSTLAGTTRTADTRTATAFAATGLVAAPQWRPSNQAHRNWGTI